MWRSLLYCIAFHPIMLNNCSWSQLLVMTFLNSRSYKKSHRISRRRKNKIVDLIWPLVLQSYYFGVQIGRLWAFNSSFSKAVSSSNIGDPRKLQGITWSIKVLWNIVLLALVYWKLRRPMPIVEELCIFCFIHFCTER